MAKTGISPKDWQGAPAPSFTPCPVGHGLEFECIEAIEEFYEKGNYQRLKFTGLHVDDEGEEYKVRSYYELSHEKLGFLRGFLEKIGRADAMATDDFDWDELVGTQFTSDIRHTQSGGSTFANFIYGSLAPLSHEYEDLDALLAGDGEAAEDADLDSKIEEEAERNAKEAEEAQKALKNAKNLKGEGSKPASKASPRRPRSAGANR
jgi:hypothetical protein